MAADTNCRACAARRRQLRGIASLRTLRLGLRLVCCVMLLALAGCAEPSASSLPTNVNSTPASVSPPTASGRAGRLQQVDLLHEAGVTIWRQGFGPSAEFLFDQRPDTWSAAHGGDWPATIEVGFSARVWPKVMSLLTLSAPMHEQRGDAGAKASKPPPMPRCEVSLLLGDAVLQRFEAVPGSHLTHELALAAEAERDGIVGPLRWELQPVAGDVKSRCQRLRVAELQVSGELEARDRRASANPSPRDKPPAPAPAPGSEATLSTPRAFCAQLLPAFSRHGNTNEPAARPACRYQHTLRPTNGKLAPPFKFVHQFNVSEQDTTDRLLLVIETERGIHPEPIVLLPGINDDRAGSYAAAAVEFLATEGQELWLGVVKRSALAGGYAGGPEQPHDVVGQLTYNCRLQQRLSCVGAPTAFGEHSPFEGPLAYQTGGYSGPFVPEVWHWTRAFSVDDAQQFRFGPCLDRRSNVVPCRSSRYLGWE